MEIIRNIYSTISRCKPTFVPLTKYGYILYQCDRDGWGAICHVEASASIAICNYDDNSSFLKDLHHEGGIE